MRIWTPMPPALRGILLMVLSTIGFAIMHALVRYVSSELHPFQIAFFRNAFGFLIFLPWFYRHGIAPLRTRNFPLHGLRAVLNCLAMFAFFTALSLTPIAQVTALAFTAPIFAAMLGVFVLGERVHLRRWSAISVGFLGTLVILRPGFQIVDLGSSLVLVSALLWAATMIVIKVLGRTESSMTITCYMNLLLTGLSFLPALFVWQSPSLAAWLWLLAIGLLGTAAQIALAQSLKEAETSVVMPLDFLKLIWTAALGYWLFSEVPDIFVWIGGATIFASGLYIAYRESRISRRGDARGLDGPE